MNANITLMLREKDVQLFLKAMQQLQPETEDEAQNRTYWLDILGYLAMPEKKERRKKGATKVFPNATYLIYQ